MPATRRISSTLRSGALALLGLSMASTAVAIAPATAASAAETSERRAPAAAAKRLNSRILTAQQIALNQRGDVYAYGAAGPNAFDCSGLIAYSYGRAGVSVPRTSDAQAGATRRIAKHNMRPGDLMFFHSGGNVYHAAIFIGFKNGRAMMVHSPGSGRRVTVAAPWTSSWFGGTLRR
ncbi:C40 family peptidase [Nocardioides piscis]|uniref:C40 family peptidase n=1 Tax=Nocardioides piscis TaxID=2714938 RepID=A0A6G7YBV0_9ACTN|nr:C40 family peptidase [Nocardioides piscis]QIK74087.1 C40 family peptidase [Nocardioides piscis]